MEHNEEYEKHYSPDGERIEYLMEHPEENNQPIEEKWKEKFNNRFDIGPIFLKSGGVRISALYGPEEIISFIENILEQERKRLAKRIIKDDVTCPEAYGFEGRDTFSACEKCVVCELRSIINK